MGEFWYLDLLLLVSSHERIREDQILTFASQFLEVLEGNSILLAVAKMVPAAISGAIAAIITGILISKIQPGWIMLVSMTAFCIGQILLATNDVGESYWAQFFVATIIVTWGMVSRALSSQHQCVLTINRTYRSRPAL